MRASLGVLALFLVAGACASGEPKPTGEKCSDDDGCGPGERCIRERCVSGASGGAGEGGSEAGAAGSSAGAGGGGASAGQGGSAQAGQGGGAGEGAVGVQCKETDDGCGCTRGPGEASGTCGKSKHPSSVCCPSSKSWPDDGICSCREIRAQPTSNGCVLGYSTSSTDALQCKGGTCCLSGDKLACQCFNDGSKCPGGYSEVAACTADRLGCGDGEAVSDCVP